MASIITLRWLEPEPGEEARVADITEDDAIEVGEVIVWLEHCCPDDEWGNTVPRADIFSTAARGGDMTFQQTLEYLADSCRYDTGEGIYFEDCPTLKKYGIQRS